MKKKLLVISSYPPKGITHAKEVVGVATYTKNTLTSLLSSTKNNAPEITVFAEKLPGSDTSYIDEGITVKRVWKRKSLFSFVHLTRAVLSEKTTAVLFELELAMFGGVLHLLPLPLFLLLLRLLGKKPTIVFHQIITSVSDVHGQLNLPEKGLKTTLYTFLLRLFYSMVLLLCTKAIVFDEYLKTQLSNFGNSQKIVVIPHGIEAVKAPLTQKEARKKLQLPVDRPILFSFGFLAWYKGTDRLIDSYTKLPKENRPLLVIAGGPNPNHTDKAFYNRYITSIETKAKEHGIIITGFVPEELITTYYQAADLCILPYRTFMSSSGPLSFVFAAHKPFLLSDKLRPLFATKDIARIMKKHGLSEETFTFSTETELAKKTQMLLQDTSLQQKIKELDREIVSERSWEKLGGAYYEALFA